MALNNLGLGFIFTARDHASRTIDSISKSFTRMERAQTQAQRVMQMGAASMVGSMASIAAGKKLLDAAFIVAGDNGKFQQSLQVLGVVAEATTEEIALMRKAAMDVNTSSQFNPHEKLEALDVLAQRGLTAKDSITALNATLGFATAAQLSSAQAGRTLGSALSVFSLDASKAAEVSDKLMRATTMTAIEANDLEIMLGTVARGSFSTTQELIEMVVAMGLVKNIGVEASTAASAVSSSLVMAMQNSDKLKKLGVNLTDASGKVKPFFELMLETSRALESVTDEGKRGEIISDIFGKFGMTAMMATTKQLAFGVKTTTGEIVKMDAAVNYLKGRLIDAEGTTAAFSDAVENSLPGRIKQLETTMTALRISVGEAFAEFAKPHVEKAIAFVKMLMIRFDELPPSVKRFIAVATYAASAGLILAGVLLFVVGAIALLAPAIPAIVSAFSAIAPAILPVLVVLAALTLAFIAMKEGFDRNIGGFGDRVRNIFNKVKLAAQGIMQFIQYGFARGDIAKNLAKKENAGVLAFVRMFVVYAFRIKRFFQGIGEGFSAAVDRMGPTFDLLISAFENLGVALGLFSEDSLKSMGHSDKWKKAGIAIGFIIGGVAEAIVRTVAFVAWVANGLIRIWGLVASYITGLINEFVEFGISIEELILAAVKLSDEFKVKLHEALKQVASKVSELMGTAGQKVSEFFDKIKAKKKEVVEAIKNFFLGMMSGNGKMVDDMLAKWDKFYEKIKTVKDFLLGTQERAEAVYDVIGFFPNLQRVKNLFSDESPADAANTETYLPSVSPQAIVPTTQPTPVQITNIPKEAPHALNIPRSKSQQQGALTQEGMQMAVQAALVAHSKLSQKRPETIIVTLDGEKVGQGVRNRERNRAGNAFVEGEWGHG